MSDVSSSEEAFFLVCKYLLTMNPPESILNPIQIVKGVPGFIVTLYQIAGQNRMCVIISHILFLLLGGFQRRATALLGRKNPKKPAVSWQGIQRGQRPLGTRLCLQSLVCYTFAKGLAANGLFCPHGWGKRRRARLELRSDYSGRRQPGPAPEQRDTVPAAHLCPDN